jgi:hypothetical protein
MLTEKHPSASVSPVINQGLKADIIKVSSVKQNKF